MKALPFLLRNAPKGFNEMTSQSGSYEHGTISLFDGSAGRAKSHYRALNI
jgi:hypothetical protein